MKFDLRESIKRSLSNLVTTHNAMLAHFDETNNLLKSLLELDPFEFFQREVRRNEGQGTVEPRIDVAMFSIVDRGRPCFLGNTLPYRLLVHLLSNPGKFISHEDLLAAVWGGATRTDSSIRSVVKDLRHRLRKDGLRELADAIDGSQPGHYAYRPVN